jgi:glycosyltransferase involved in cell wall biosynthesis
VRLAFHLRIPSVATVRLIGAMSGSEKPIVLQYVGYDHDRGGILAVIRALAAENCFTCVLGVNPAYQPSHRTVLPTLPLPALDGDRINPLNALRAWRVAREVRRWLSQDPRRIFHGHSRAGLMVALWLRAFGERRVLATVHCYGRQRWFYRWAARRLKDRILWLTPAMKRYYGLPGVTWAGCMPGCINPAEWPARRHRADHDTVRFGCVGALVPVKEWDLVVRALAEVPGSVPLRIAHAGGEDGSQSSARCAAELRRAAASLSAPGRLEWQGEVQDMTAFYEAIDCLLVVSRHEAFSIAALEAAASGVPILAPAGSGTEDIVNEARVGWLFSPGSAEDLARMMVRLTTSGELRRWTLDREALGQFMSPVVAAKQAAEYERLLRA